MHFSTSRWRRGEYTDCPCEVNALLGKQDKRCVEPMGVDIWGLEDMYAVFGYMVLVMMIFVLLKVLWLWRRNRVRWAAQAEVRVEAALAERNRLAELDMPPLTGVMVGRYKLNPVLTHGLKAPGFNH
jgi:hypothetical protein